MELDRAPTRVSRRAGILVAAVLPLLVLAPALMRQVTSTQDEGQLLAYPALILRGHWPNTDFTYVYGINNLWTLAGAFRVVGESLIVERLVGLLFRLVIVVVLTDMVRRVGGALAARSWRGWRTSWQSP